LINMFAPAIATGANIRQLGARPGGRRGRANDRTGTVSAMLTHRKSTLAKATRRHASGKVTLKLRTRPNAKKGHAELTLRVAGVKPLVQAIKVTKRG
jgi:hypothetical protein